MAEIKHAKKILVAMSGGVDSSTAAMLLLRQGHEVAGITLKVWQDKSVKRGSLDAVKDARKVCGYLGIKHYVLDVKEEFKKRIVNDFVREYLAGRTPNPCIICNETIKFGRLMVEARKLGYDFLATGHYARIVKKGAKYFIRKGADRAKDQSYVLYRIKSGVLKSVLFPIGGYTKKQVRELAKNGCLPTAEKPESQEICFLGKDYASFIRSYAAPGAVKPGPIYDKAGNIIGTHKGIPFYTVGQHSGLGIISEEPLYVLKIDRARNAIIAGKKGSGYSSVLRVRDVVWPGGKPENRRFSGMVKIRRLQEPAKAVIGISGRSARVEFLKPQLAVTPGQSAVFYRNGSVIGGGFIAG